MGASLMSSGIQSRIREMIFKARYKKRNFGGNKGRWFLIILIIGVVSFFSSTKVKSIREALTPPKLPELQVVDSQGQWLEQVWIGQNWGGTQNQPSEDTRKYHHISQGTATLPIPYDWFIHLEQPDPSIGSFLVNSLFSRESSRFSANEHLLRFGFIRSEPHPIFNPDGLPIGFAKSNSLNIPGYTTKTEGIGFTCSACHTGHFIHGEGDNAKEYVIEGGPAATDLGQLTAVLGAALGQTVLSSKLPLFDGRFDRFARRVLGTQYNAGSKLALAANFANIIKAAQKTADIVAVQEGFTRLDALNRIGNQVFSKNVDIRENYQPIDAPVNYPHIWTAGWFNWVQYDGSIMGPLIRNAGEAMGVNAHVSMTSPKNENRYDSTIPMANLVWLEDFLKGPRFNQGLTGPAWPFAKVDENGSLYRKGKALYEDRCQGCHLPVLENPKLDKYISPIVYLKDGELQQTDEDVLHVKIIPEAQIGTDPAQANVLQTRTISTAGDLQGRISQIKNGLGIDKVVCGQDPNQVFKNELFGEKADVMLVENIEVKDGGEISFGMALGALVEQTIDAWFAENNIQDQQLMDKFMGGRPNCLQVGNGYKARPLNGVWATAPFLHNGSVPTVKDLICKTEEQRPRFVQLGHIEFDTNNLGLSQPDNFEETAKSYRENHKLYTDEGYFILDTSLTANSNRGHNFSDEYAPNKHYSKQKQGVIGPKFNAEECSAIIEYVKTL